MAESNQFALRIITPERVFYEDEVDMAEFNTTEGEVGIYRNHIPMTMIIKSGVLTITKGDEKKHAALHEGFVEVLQEKVTILAEVIEWPDEIDVARAEAARDRAEERLAHVDEKINVARAEAALARALTRIQIIK
ncbi:MAG: ATP synthase F1 subunit epsilon [Lachnospiraceae bacterium]|nr:ATP synthase F1 subunit epsilon [Lachnospiraceae bacterium]MBR2402162.1 ATP synthase F1 subunit epsilon [Lachnospiraceae bacterium]MBR3683356.1 ATP synthase F1 subunit epsilon [Lachnospiraceae bacterium]